MKIILLTLTLLSLLGCNESNSSFNENQVLADENQTPDKYGDLRDFPSLQNQENIDSLISGMTQDNCVYEKSSGIAGDYTYSYACFDRLTQLVSDQEIYQMVRHPNPNVRLYALNELKNNQSVYLDSAKITLKDDHSRVWTLSGASKKNVKLSDLVKSNPIDKIKSMEHDVEYRTAETKNQ